MGRRLEELKNNWYPYAFVAGALAILSLVSILMFVYPPTKAAPDPTDCTGMYTEAKTFDCLEDKIDNLARLLEEHNKG